jgi:superfamily II DNA helicase RecQ
VRDKPSRGSEALQKVLEYVQHCRRASQTGIVYSMTRKETEEMASFLRRSGVSADYYHAGQVVDSLHIAHCPHTRRQFSQP